MTGNDWPRLFTACSVWTLPATPMSTACSGLQAACHMRVQLVTWEKKRTERKKKTHRSCFCFSFSAFAAAFSAFFAAFFPLLSPPSAPSSPAGAAAAAAAGAGVSFAFLSFLEGPLAGAGGGAPVSAVYLGVWVGAIVYARQWAGGDGGAWHLAWDEAPLAGCWRE
jgi:hypothetical protein